MGEKKNGEDIDKWHWGVLFLSEKFGSLREMCLESSSC